MAVFHSRLVIMISHDILSFSYINFNFSYSDFLISGSDFPISHSDFSISHVDHWDSIGDFELNLLFSCLACQRISREIFDNGKNLPPQIRAFYIFHVYFTVRRILYQLGGIRSISALPGDSTFNQFNNHYNVASYKRLCKEGERKKPRASSWCWWNTQSDSPTLARACKGTSSR